MGLFQPKPLSSLNALIVAIPCSVLAILMAGWTIANYAVDRDFAHTQVEHVIGQIDGFHLSHYKGETRRQFYCHYLANGIRHDVHFSSDYDDGQDLQLGGPMPIKYLHNWPEVSRIDLPWADAERARDAQVMPLIPLVLAAMSAYGFWQFRIAQRRKKHARH